jgi:predicted DNA-binding transcriptional regulator AlpA
LFTNERRIGMTDNLARMLRVEELAALTGISVSYFNKLRVTGGGPPFRKVGRRVVYGLADVEDWLAARRRSSTSDMENRR